MTKTYSRGDCNMYQLSGIQKMWTDLRWIVTSVAVLFVLASGVAGGQDVLDTAFLGSHAEGRFATTPVIERAQPQRRLPQSRLPAQVILDPALAANLKREATPQTYKPGVPLKIGFSRDVPMLRNSFQTSAMMVWASVPGGQVAAISITSPDALGVRLGLLVEKLSTSALLRFYAQGSNQVFEVSGQEIMETIARNIAAGDKSAEASTYWSPVIKGQEVTVEIDLPADVSTKEVMLSIPRISHLFSSPMDTRALIEKIGQSGACNLDSMCYASIWGNESLATARMTFMSGGVAYLCTGTLLSDNSPSTNIPFFLSANHCISTQTEASTLQTYWFYYTSGCNSGNLYPSTQTLAGGATLLYSSSVTDTSFMRLNTNPPPGVYYSGWSNSLPLLSNSVTGIHNPSGDLQKISFGTIIDYLSCPTTPGNTTYNCTSSASGNADHFEVIWSQGITEGGSSGSGLWIASGNSHYLVGQLHGGSSYCATPTAPDEYGRFDVAYNVALYQWLGTTSSCSYSLNTTNQPVGADAAVGTVNVTAASGCAWTATSNANWITIISGASGSGNGVIDYAIVANSSASARTGTLSIAGQTLTITQSAPSCTYTLNPTSKNFNSRNGNIAVDVTATGDNCTLKPTESYDWITTALSGRFIQNRMTKKWSGKVIVGVTENKSSVVRTGTVDIGGKTFTVTQSGVPCILTITPAVTKTPMAGAGDTGSFTVTAPAGCSWTSAPFNAAWLTITSGSSGSGNGVVYYTGSKNTTGTMRTGRINVESSDKKSKKIFTAVQNK